MQTMTAPISNPPAPRSQSDGFIVVAVLWILGALSALLSIYAVFVIDTAAGFAVYDDRLRSESLVSAALELTAYRQLTAAAQSRPSHGRFSFRLGQANVAVEFQSEAARIDLNAASKPLLTGLFVALGARRDIAELYADRVINWRTAPAQDQNSESMAYRAAGLAYEPRGGKFPNVAELTLVRDLPEALVERALPYVTVFNGRPQVNILDAAPEVIAALPGITTERVNAVLAQRQASPDDGKAALALLGEARQYASTEVGKTVRVNVQIAFDNGQKAGSEAVISIFDAGDEPYAVLSWHDEIYGTRPDEH
jgi:general secretion pathway protein K